MSLYPLDSVRNAKIERHVEIRLEALREDLSQNEEWEPYDRSDVLEAFDQARPRLNAILTLVAPVQGRVLDVSTGLGFLPPLLVSADRTVLATEREVPIARYAARTVSVLPYVIGTGILPVKEASCDAIILGEVLEHLKIPPIRAIAEITRMLRPGGRFLLSTPNIARLTHLETLAAGENFLESFPEWIPLGADATDFVEHVREYSIREVVDAVEGAGLEIESVSMTGWGQGGYEPAPNPYANDICLVWARKPDE